MNHRSSMLELVNTHLSCHEGALGLRQLTASRARWLVFFRLASCGVQRSFWLTRRTRLRQHHGQLVFVAFLILRFHHAPSAAGHCKPSLPIQILYKPASFPIFLLASTCIGPQNVLYVRMCFVASYARRFPPPLLALI
jgi:hypothetical protein